MALYGEHIASQIDLVSGEVGSVSIVSRSSLATGFLASNEMSGYGGCTKEEGEAVY
jgi:hypothetical protein